MARVLSFLIRYFSKYYTLHRSDLAARAVPLDPRLNYEKIFHRHQFIETAGDYHNSIFQKQILFVTSSIVYTNLHYISNRKRMYVAITDQLGFKQRVVTLKE